MSLEQDPQAKSPNLDKSDIIILQCLANGWSRPEIAGFLHWKVYKADARIQDLLKEFGCKNAAQLVATVIRRGIIE